MDEQAPWQKLMAALTEARRIARTVEQTPKAEELLRHLNTIVAVVPDLVPRERRGDWTPERSHPR